MRYPIFVAVFLLFAPLSADAYRYTHEILPGETLETIARRYQINIKEIKRHNRIRGHRIRAGRKLKIISKKATRTRSKNQYTVRKGDSLGRIASKHKMKLGLLKALNRRAAKRPLQRGMKLWVVVEGSAPKGRIKGLVQMRNGVGYTVRRAYRAWGTMNSLTQIADVHGAYHRKYPRAAPLRVYDLSQKGGGRIPPHVSHQKGRDVDLPYVQLAGKTRRKATGDSLDLERTWFLIKRFVDTNEVKYIFMEYRLQKALYEYALKSGVSKGFVDDLFQYPSGKNGGKGIIRHEPGHATHYHVRFYPGPHRSTPTS